MERKEFELILKRALELQSFQKGKAKADEYDYSSEDLYSAAARLGINEEILAKAIDETGNRFKKFHLNASPDDAREAFLKHFLMQETNASLQHKPLRIDHNTIKIGSNTAIRVIHPQASSIEAFVEFSDDGSGGTNVSWRGNFELDTRTKVLIGGWPFLIFGVLFASAIVQGLALLPILPILLIFLFTSQIMLWGTRKNAARLEENLVSYFQNCQTLDEIEAHKQMKKELESYRKNDADSINEEQKKLLRQSVNELNEDLSEEPSEDENPRDGRVTE